VNRDHGKEAGGPGRAGDPGDTLNVSTVSVDMRFAPKDSERAVQLLLSGRAEILTKRGCRSCDVATEAGDEGLVHYREVWESGELFHEHVRSEEFRRVLIAMDLSCEEPRIVVGKLCGHSGLAYLRSLREPDGRR
jgi:quinol monooxygenase YgiN